ncbi:MAG: Ig-like domain-containing protein, partial [Myxococcota bacterium]
MRRWSTLRTPASFVLLAACLRAPVAPLAPASEGATPPTEARVSFREDPEADGLVMELYEARPADGAAEKLPLPPTTPLTDAETAALLARLPALGAADDAVPFALRQGPTPPPRTGATVQLPFPPPESAPAAEVAQGPLTVLRKAPEGDVPLAPHLSVTFSRPMVALTDADTAAKTVPVTLTPAPKGEWRWLGTKTVVFQPDGRFPMATRYAAEIPAGTTSADGAPLAAPVTWSFATPPLTLTDHWPDAYAPAQSLTPALLLAFDQHVSPDTLLPSVHVRGAGRTVPVRLARPDEIPAHLEGVVERVEKGRAVVVVPAEPLANATTYTVTVQKGAPSAEGPLGTTGDQSFSFETFGALTVEPPTCWERPCPPDAGWSMSFSNPLDEEAFDAAAITVEPAVPGLSVVPSGQTVGLYGGFAPRTTYTVRVAAGIRDVFGQTLAKA